MKQLLLVFFIGFFLLSSSSVFSQGPSKINFQAILRNTSGEIVSNKSVSIRMSIIRGTINSTSSYVETHAKTTDVSGLISIQLGTGTVISGIFGDIEWGGGSHFIQLEVDFNGGSNYVVIGTQELISVPYALYANKTDTSVLNLTSRFSTKLNVTDTASMSNRIDAKANKSDTSLLNLTSRFSMKLNVTDTAILSNRIDTKLNVTDLTNMLLPYLRDADTTNMLLPYLQDADTTAMLANYRTGINDKLNILDTTSMLSTYLRRADTTSMLLPYLRDADTTNMLVPYLRDADTTNMLVPYLRDADTTNMLNSYFKKSDTTSLNLTNRFNAKLNVTDFPQGSASGNILIWNNGNWVNLAPGSPGQFLIISSNGLPTWGCIITNTVGSPSSSPSILVNTALTNNITISTTGATGIGTATGLPTGVTASWSNDVITISGTPTETGSFTYTIPLTGGCGSVNATGTITVTVFTCGTNTVSDIDGNPYNTVLIGNQCWTKENLRVRRYNDGTWIRFDNSGGSLGTTSQTWAGTELNYGAHTIYANDSVASPSYLTTYGYLYNWYAAKGIATSGSTTYKNICPTGWHVPTDSDWNKLVKSIHSDADTTGSVDIQSASAGAKLKKNDALWASNTGTDDYGFSALPGGFRIGDIGNNSFSDVRDFALFWSSTEWTNCCGWIRYLNKDNSNFYRFNYIRTIYFYKSVGASVRCLKD